jgi:hypothetical protein
MSKMKSRDTIDIIFKVDILLIDGNPIYFNRLLVYLEAIMCYYYCLAYKDETTITSTTGTMAASVIDLRPLPTTLAQRTEILHHHHQPYRKLPSNTLNKTDEHCRSLFNLLPTSLRPRHRQTSIKKDVDAVSTKKRIHIASYCRCY